MMKYLLDTNIWLEIMLDQENSDEVERFLQKIPSEQIIISDFSLHSLGVILCRLKKTDVFLEFIRDISVNSSIKQMELRPDDLEDVVQMILKANLDFDDAYQYTISQKYGMQLITFDKDFIKAGLSCKKPSEML